jgi:hypothetical protein
MNYQPFPYAVAAFAMASSAHAAPPTAVVAAPPEATAQAASPFAGAATIDDAALAGSTAREDLSLVAQTEQTGNVSNNQIRGRSNTGDVQFLDRAFENASGMTIVNANSGNNVSMNASFNVNIVITPPPQQ